MSFIFALGYNAVRTDGIPLRAQKDIVTGDDIATVDSLLADTTILTTPVMVDLDLAKRMYDRGVVFIDARDEEEFRGGHIERALNMSVVQLASQLPPHQPVVIYCSGESCELSWELSETLMIDWGFTRIFVFEGGWPEWVQAGYPTKAAE